MVSGPDGKSQAEKRAEAVNRQRNIRVATTSEQGRRFLQNQAANSNLEELRQLSQAGVGRDILSARIQQGIADKARAAGYSESQARSVVRQQVQINQLRQQSQTLQQRAITEQARIKVNQLAKKNEKILRELKSAQVGS